MIAALCGAMLLLWRTAADLSDPRTESAALVAGVAVISTVMQIAPWLLYLRLFRRPRAP
jgi:hypothetical protein